MTRFADPHRCPDCRMLLAAGSQRCGHCGLDLSGELGQRLFVTLSTADELLVQLRARSEQTVGTASEPVLAGAVAAPTGPQSTPPSTPPTTPPATPSTPTLGAALPPLGPGGPGAGAPTSSPYEPAGVRPSSVPKILLSLGATCLLVAALVFLAVTWSVMGVGGRTVTLVALTVVMAGLTALSARHALRGAVEAIGLVTTGLAVLDVVGARTAGWFGDPSDAAFATVVGALLVGGGIAATAVLLKTPARGFTVGEVTVAAGSLVLFWGMNEGAWATAEVRALVTTVVLATLAGGVWTRVRESFRVAAVGTTVVAAYSWLVQSMSAVDSAADHPTVAALWGRFEVWPVLAAAAVGVAVASVRRIPRELRVVSLAVSVVLVSVAVTLPAYDETPTQVALTLVAAVLVLAAGVAFVPRPWGAAGLAALGLGAVALLVPVVGIATGALQVYGDTAGLGWTGTASSTVVPAYVGDGVGAAWLLPVCVAALVVAGLAVLRLVDGLGRLPVRRAAAVVAGLLVLSGVATVLHYEVPVWTVLAGLLLAAAAAVVLAVARDSRSLAVLGSVLVLVAVPLSFADEALTAGTLGVALILAAIAHVVSRDVLVREVAAGVLPCVVAGLSWSAGAAFDAEPSWSALVGLLVLGALMLGRGLLDRQGTAASAVAVLEGCTGLAALPLAAAGVASAPVSETSSWLAVYLTVAGAYASALALLRADRRQVAWLGGFLLAAATWVRLLDLGVHEPEAYTLPSALALLVVGLLHLRRHPGASTQTALGAGLALALVPSLLWVLLDPTGPRALLLGLACLALVVAGALARWSAPLTHGAVVGLLLVLREAGPMVGDSVPRWALIGAAGVLLIGLGVTWEARMRDAKRAVSYVRSLR